MSSKRVISLILLIIVACGLVYGGYTYHQYQQASLFRRARALEGIGELSEAIQTLKAYLTAHPSDLSAKAYLAKLYHKHEEYEKALLIWKKVGEDAKARSLDDFTALSREGLMDCFLALAQIAQDSAQQMMNAENFEDAARLYRLEFDHWLNWIQVDTLADTSGFRLKEYISGYDLPTAKSNELLMYWLLGRHDKTSSELAAARWIVYIQGLDLSFRSSLYEQFASKLDELGSEEFDKKNFGLARTHWRKAIEVLSMIDSDIPSVDIPRLRYNVAMTYWNQQDFSKARTLLGELRKEFPDFDAEKVKNLLREGKQASVWKAEDNICRQADKAFGEKRWSQARAHYREAVNYLLSSGVTEDHIEVCRLRYNIAIAYYNDALYEESRTVLEELKKANPDYNPEHVAELLNQIDRWLR